MSSVSRILLNLAKFIGHMSGGIWSLLSDEPSSSGVDHSHEPSCRGVDHTCRGVDYGHEPSCSGDKVYICFGKEYILWVLH